MYICFDFFPIGVLYFPHSFIQLLFFCLIIFICLLNGIMLLTSDSTCKLLLYEKVIQFYILILSPITTLLQLIKSYNKLAVIAYLLALLMLFKFFWFFYLENNICEQNKNDIILSFFLICINFIFLVLFTMRSFRLILSKRASFPYSQSQKESISLSH